MSGFGDADIEMAELNATADREAALRHQGYCTHSYRQGGLPGGLTKCLDCGKVATEEDLDEERQELLS